MMAEEEQVLLQQQHLDWSAQQGRILTCNGRAEEFYTAERGFPFTADELPHHRLQQHGNKTLNVLADEPWHNSTSIAGVWKRTKFYSTVLDNACTTDATERVYNVQTPAGWFIDLRIPHSRDRLLDTTAILSLDNLSPLQLRYYARQHVFGGRGNVNLQSGSKQQQACTRHHAIDWNYVGTPRSRPNKWYIEPHANTTKESWTEWAWATATDSGRQQQPYYGEDWESLVQQQDNVARTTILVLRTTTPRAGLLIVIGNHFSYILDRVGTSTTTASSLVQCVDTLVQNNKITEAKAWLSIQAGHGRIFENGGMMWKIDAAIEFWKEGEPLFGKGDIQVANTTVCNQVTDCRVQWFDQEWMVCETNLQSRSELEHLLRATSDTSRL